MPKVSQPQRKPMQKHLSLVLSAVAIVVVAVIAAASYHAHKSNLAANTNSSSSTGTNVSGGGSKYSTDTNNTSTTSSSGSSSQTAGGSGAKASTNSSQGLYLSPSGTTLAPGSTFTVQIRENSGSSAVNAVQANLSYPTDKLKFVSIDAGSSAFSIAAPSSGSGGKVSIARGSTTPVTGDQNVATVTFTVTGSGSATLAFTSGSALVTSTNHTNVAGSLSGATYHIQ